MWVQKWGQIIHVYPVKRLKTRKKNTVRRDCGGKKNGLEGEWLQKKVRTAKKEKKAADKKTILLEKNPSC